LLSWHDERIPAARDRPRLSPNRVFPGRFGEQIMLAITVEPEVRFRWSAQRLRPLNS
jgi:hypothetical protein